MLLLIDLDNTLVDHAAAFKTWADTRFGRSPAAWPADADGNEQAPSEVLAAG